tara:strand:+ start:1098 stop:1370 length:273 start_codon:yes stop_codon:yes gene_type:complete
MIDQELLQELEDNECLLADGFDDALIGITEGMNPVSVYDTDKCIEVLIRDSKMNHEDAVEYFYFNVVGAYVGEKTPVFLRMFGDEYHRTL